MQASVPAGVSLDSRAGFIPRLIAYLIDGVILGIVYAAIPAILGAILGDSGAPIGLLIAIVIGVAYMPYFWSTSGATPGKNIMGLRVVSVDGSPLSVGKAIKRLLGYVASSAIFDLGFLWILWDKDKQGWHDKIAGTYVVKTR